jgi:hypothetical protein
VRRRFYGVCAPVNQFRGAFIFRQLVRALEIGLRLIQENLERRTA